MKPKCFSLCYFGLLIPLAMLVLFKLLFFDSSVGSSVVYAGHSKLAGEDIDVDLYSVVHTSDLEWHSSDENSTHFKHISLPDELHTNHASAMAKNATHSLTASNPTAFNHHTSELHHHDHKETDGEDVEYGAGDGPLPLPINPGCLHRKFDKYKPIDTGEVYHHPSIVHYAKLSPDDVPVSFNFLEFVSVMSAYKFLRPEKILIHTYTDVVGEYWDLMQKWTGVSVEAKMADRVTHFGEKEVKYIQHQADYVKLTNLLKLGGVISDFDVIIISGKRVRDAQRISECVLSKGGPTGQFVNIGFVSCVRNSSFIRRWLEGYFEDFRPELYVFNGSFIPLRILEDKHSKVCYNVYLDDTICLDPNATEEKARWWQRQGVNWRAKTAAHYFLKKVNSKTILSQDNSLADMLRYVLDA